MLDRIEKKWDHRFLGIAGSIAGWSKDPSTGIGAVCIDPFTRRITATGYNGFPRAIEDRPELLGTRGEKSRRMIHAEMNCICHAAEHGVSLQGAHLYVHGLPVCGGCAPMVIQVGIDAIVQYCPEVPERWTESCVDAWELFEEAGVSWRLYTRESIGIGVTSPSGLPFGWRSSG